MPKGPHSKKNHFPLHLSDSLNSLPLIVKMETLLLCLIIINSSFTYVSSVPQNSLPFRYEMNIVKEIVKGKSFFEIFYVGFSSWSSRLSKKFHKKAVKN